MFHLLVIASMFIPTLTSNSLESNTLSSSQLFTFAQPQSFLQLKPEWSLPAIREVTFKFRTDRPHGLLLFHGSISDVKTFPLYELYVMLENGCLKIIHVFLNDQDETFFIGKGLNRDKWHHVTLRINPGTAHLSVTVDSHEMTVNLPSLSHYPGYGVVDSMPETVMYFGGLDPNNYATNQKYNYVRFVGCMGTIMFSQSGNPLSPTKIILANQLVHGCIDQCEISNPCLYDGRCINHYTHTSCDCFGTRHEDKICFSADPVTVTFRGYSYITYRVYDWRDRVHSEAGRISFSFRTFFEDSVLMYASGEHVGRNYVAISLFGGQLHFEINFGDGPLNSTIGYSLNDEAWHTFTVIHSGREVNLQLDSRWHASLLASSTHHHLHLDPEIYIGASPKKAKGLKSKEKFIGCLRSFYFNDKNVLHSLFIGESTARYHSMFAAEYGCDSTNVIPMTFPLPESKLILTMPSTKKLELSLEFKTLQTNCVLASGEIKTESGIGVWELLLHKGIALFVINRSPKEDPTLVWTLNDEHSGKQLADDEWHHVGVTYDSGEVKLEVDYRFASKGEFTHPLEFMSQMILTTSAKNAERGFIGCMRDIYVAGDWIDPRTVVDTKQVSGKVSLDSCLLVNLCNNPHACEHGGRCYVEKGETYCDCEKTGYTGRTCHFSLYKRTCEELYLVGYRKKGVYTIDIDRNGDLPPAHVYCDMGDSGSNQIVTRVENNMPPEMVVRKAGMKSFSIDVTYREFTPEMLQSLVRHSKTCSQHLKYECFRTPLGLRTFTWMESSGSSHYITSIGSQSEGCKCAETKSCANSSLLCNCDIADARWRVDEGEYTNPSHLGITRIYILQPDDLEAAAEGRLTLGPLECEETDTQEYVITFKTWNSYIEVPGWRRGDIAFSFRTSNSQAVLIYQASIHHTHGYLRVLLINDYELSFEFTLNNRPRSVKVTSRRKLNSGEWQQVWVDHDSYHMRFTVNLDFAMVDYGESHGVGPFEGPLYVGGVPEHVAGDSSIKEGFIGCFRGLVINDVVVDLYKHMTRSESAIVHGCQPSCASNPCQNGATCVEYWGSYVCECVNPFAHSGKNCETNVNTNAMTVVVPRSYYHHKIEGNLTNPVFEQNILLNFRTFEKEGILLYAFDHYNNFVQLHFANRKVYFTFNSDRTLYQLAVEVEDLSKGSPVQVKVERQPKSTTLFVNDKNATEDVIIRFVDKYFRMPWHRGEHLETVFPPRGTYRTIEHSEMFLGHVGSGTETNLTKGGFAGCIQGFMIGNQTFDLEKAATTTNPDEKYGILIPGCTMMCDYHPCQNQGVCIEHWRENITSCDCSLTSYTGEACQKDIGGNFDGTTTLTYAYDDEDVTLEMQDDVAVRLAFSTDSSTSTSLVLLLVQFHVRKYILFGISDDHTLFVEEKLSNNVVRRRAKTLSTWSDNNRHWFYFTWKSGIVTLIVDGENYNPYIQFIDTNTVLFEGTSNSLHVAGLPSSIESQEYKNFKGCISNVIVEFGNLVLTPLETAFGYQKGSLDKIKVDGSVNERKCAAFAQLSQLTATLPSNIPPEIQGPEWFPDPPVTAEYKSIFSDMAITPLESISRASNRVAAVMGVLLIIVLLALMFYIYRIQRRHKRMRMGEEYDIYKMTKRRTVSGDRSGKAVSFSPDDDYTQSAQPLVRFPDDSPPAYTPAVSFGKSTFIPNEPNGRNLPISRGTPPDSIEMAPLRSTSSQELEWDPAGAQLVSTALDDMNPDESEKQVDEENEDEDGPLPELKNQFAPLASASEVTINRLSQTFT
ncbi:axotactin-like [Argiope bruennichi]|uniref:axotactin-like n=1 Tax=Argiope bruennichi TaxID=94029 RepID=UPI002495011A|nr:axotactin-like [Argiope bruennichi]XP_055933049.1 axotactin-like [Argiope bruennichi]XP_055933050.1 axotactin-like [Argiope bruennichi]XP_055933051.1 axotactin-like [Argiope bruennichi]XP_055933052.1 axotactin-like [Argiope bruennichi]